MGMIPEEFLARFIIHLLSEKGVAIYRKKRTMARNAR